MACNCDSANRRKSGSLPFTISEFTNTYQSWYSFSNYHIIDIISCSDCKMSWLLISSLIEEPNYSCDAYELSEKDLKKLLDIGKEKLDLLISDQGPTIVKSMISKNYPK